MVDNTPLVFADVHLKITVFRVLRKQALVPGAAEEMARIRALLALGMEALGAYEDACLSTIDLKELESLDRDIRVLKMRVGRERNRPFDDVQLPSACKHAAAPTISMLIAIEESPSRYAPSQRVCTGRTWFVSRNSVTVDDRYQAHIAKALVILVPCRMPCIDILHRSRTPHPRTSPHPRTPTTSPDLLVKLLLGPRAGLRPGLATERKGWCSRSTGRFR